MDRTKKGRPRHRRTGRALLGLGVAAMVVLSASGASASVDRGIGNDAPTAIEACDALVAGTVPAGPGRSRNVVADASRSCATVCGVLAITAQKGKLAKVETDQALLSCAAACDFIVFFGTGESAGKKAIKSPIQAAVDACKLLAAVHPEGTDGLPLIENGGRSWR